MVVFLEPELEAMGEVGAPAATPEVDMEMEMEAAEQLIQLSGGCGDDGGGESESRSADSVRCCECEGASAAGKEKDRDPAVESCRKRDERLGPVKDGTAAGDGDEVAIGGDARRRPRLRSLTAIYRETRRLRDRDVGGCRGGAADQESERKGKKRARDGAAGVDGRGDPRGGGNTGVGVQGKKSGS